jgi:hypothetical protein
MLIKLIEGGSGSGSGSGSAGCRLQVAGCRLQVMACRVRQDEVAQSQPSSSSSLHKSLARLVSAVAVAQPLFALALAAQLLNRQAARLLDC